jgi:hypothetical protein
MTDIQKGESKTVLLHRDAHMKRMREAHDCQPVQLDLFQMLISKNYSNSVELYTSLPDEFS